MSHFAKVENGIVTQVIVAEQDVIDSGLFGTGWVQTSYNTQGGQHPEGRPLRKNYAGVGYTYDSMRDAFIPPQPFASWTLNEATCLWDAPTPMPQDGNIYSWDEASLAWVLYVAPIETSVIEQPIIIETAATYIETPVETVVVDSSSAATSADTISTGTSDVVIDLGSNGADSVPGGV